jgi:hypothetical protein
VQVQAKNTGAGCENDHVAHSLGWNDRPARLAWKMKMEFYVGSIWYVHIFLSAMHELSNLQTGCAHTVALCYTTRSPLKTNLSTGPNPLICDKNFYLSLEMPVGINSGYHKSQAEVFCLLWQERSRLVSQIWWGTLHSVPPYTVAVTFAFEEFSPGIAAMTPFRCELLP